MALHPFTVDFEPNSYDQVPYEGWSYAQTHPDVLAVVATLRGMKPPAVETCRVLEIGCAGGYNLIPMAFSLPGAEFVGIDNSARQIAEGNHLVNLLSVPNVSFQHMDITAWDGSLGKFDYIIAHGIYSWVEAPVRAALLDLCRRSLTPHGVAYISYNTYPGWHMLTAMREMMLYHTANESDPKTQVEKAQALIELIAEANTGETPMPYGAFSSTYASLIQAYLHGNLASEERHYSLLLHDELSEVNEPFYFHQFVAALDKAGLRYVGDADFNSMLTTNIPTEVAARLQTFVRSSTDAEQYMDFIRNRSFRRSLVCQQDVTLGSSVKLPAIQSLYFSAHATPEPVERNGTTLVKFVANDGASLTTDHPVSIAALNEMNQRWPQRFSLAQLLDIAYTSLSQTNPEAVDEWQARRDGNRPEQRQQDEAILVNNLLRCFCTSAELVDFHTHVGTFTTMISDRPTASPWARWQATHRSKVADLRLKRVEVGAVGQFLLPLLDGTHDKASLIEAVLQGPVASGDWQVKDESSHPHTDIRSAVERLVDGTLDWFATAALLQE